MSILFPESAPSAPSRRRRGAHETVSETRFQSFIAGTVGYSLYYVCRTSLNVVKRNRLERGA